MRKTDLKDYQVPKMTLKPERREFIIRSVCDLKREFTELEMKNATTSGVAPGEVSVQMDSVVQQLSEFYEEYRKGLPVLPLSRCPYCNSIVMHSIDNFGLDGLWWCVDGPKRKFNDSRDPHSLAFTGAIELRPPIERMDLLVAPGPQAPFVVPGILADPRVKAVLYSIRIGKHPAYIIWYFANPIPHDLELVNDWGTERYKFQTGELDANDKPVYGIGEDSYDEDDYDFELESWIHQGKLLWIAPDDASLKLRSQVQECPYLRSNGKRRIMYVKNGHAWSDEYDF